MSRPHSRLLDYLSNKYFVFSIAVIIHISLVIAIGYYRKPVLYENGVIAKNMLEGNGFSRSPYRPLLIEKGVNNENSLSNNKLPLIMKTQTTANQAPGYPFILFLSWKVLRENPATYLIISLVQAILVSSIVFPVGWLTRRWFREEAVVWVMWIACLMPLYAWYATRLHQPAIVMTFYPWLLAGWLSMTETNSKWRAVIVGIATGLAGLFQPVLLGVFALIGIILLFKSLKTRNVTDIRRLVLATLLVLLILTPWTVRNYMAFDQLVLIKNSFGKEFWIGNNPESTGTSVLEGGKLDIFSYLVPKYIDLESQVSEMHFMKSMQSQAIDYVRSDPAAFVTRTLKKIFWFWTAVPKKYLDSTGHGKRLTFDWFQMCYWFIFLLIAGYAKIFYGKFPGEYIMVLLVFFLLNSIIYGLTFVNHARFRGEIEFIIMPAVAQGIVLLRDMGNRFSRRRLGT